MVKTPRPVSAAYFHEAASALKCIGIAPIIVGFVGLNLRMARQ